MQCTTSPADLFRTEHIAVQLIDLPLVHAVDDVSLQLEGGGEVSLGLRELRGQDAPLLHRLGVRDGIAVRRGQAGIQVGSPGPVPHELTQSAGGAVNAVPYLDHLRGEWRVPRHHPIRRDDRLDSQQHDEVLATVPNHHTVAHYRSLFLDLLLDQYRGYVLPARGDDDVLDATHDAHEPTRALGVPDLRGRVAALPVELGDIPSVEVVLGVEAGGGLPGHVHVPHEDMPALD